MLTSAPDVALCAGNGFVVEIVNEVPTRSHMSDYL